MVVLAWCCRLCDCGCDPGTPFNDTNNKFVVRWGGRGSKWLGRRLRSSSNEAIFHPFPVAFQMLQLWHLFRELPRGVATKGGSVFAKTTNSRGRTRRRGSPPPPHNNGDLSDCHPFRCSPTPSADTQNKDTPCLLCHHACNVAATATLAVCMARSHGGRAATPILNVAATTTDFACRHCRGPL